MSRGEFSGSLFVIRPVYQSCRERAEERCLPRQLSVAGRKTKIPEIANVGTNLASCKLQVLLQLVQSAFPPPRLSPAGTQRGNPCGFNGFVNLPAKTKVTVRCSSSSSSSSDISAQAARVSPETPIEWRARPRWRTLARRDIADILSGLRRLHQCAL